MSGGLVQRRLQLLEGVDRHTPKLIAQLPRAEVGCRRLGQQPMHSRVARLEMLKRGRRHIHTHEGVRNRHAGCEIDMADRHGRTVVVVLHEVNYAAAHTDRIVALKDGRLAFEGPPGVVLTAERLSSLYGTSVAVRDVEGRPVALHYA